MATSVSKVIEHFGLRASEYSSKSARGLWGYVRRQELGMVLRLLDPQPEDKILDVGCGSGFYAEAIQRTVGARVHGLDPCQEMLDRARPFCQKTYSSAIEDFTVSETFPKILIAGSFEFVEDLYLAWRRVGDAASAGAELTLLYPNAGLVGALYWIAHAFSRCPVFLRSEKRWMPAAQAAGFTIVKRIRGPVSSVYSFRKVH